MSTTQSAATTAATYDVLSDKTPIDNSASDNYIIFNSVFRDVDSYYNILGGFAVIKKYNVTLKKENIFNVIKKENVFNVILK